MSQLKVKNVPFTDEDLEEIPKEEMQSYLKALTEGRKKRLAESNRRIREGMAAARKWRQKRYNKE